ncbi:MAG TPA: cytochrome c oxidase subunit II [Candidatus Ruania gallistercoris]|uniref:cytochrome-c oxidase n=1 Tax=Candidatus Ruania gallistercoris TaxID=2838746 RepID=A0A9D2ECU1_9MICO|nr:cytochrome c oxidase subunit II [Candidatus Ruania gallistercoris]
MPSDPGITEHTEGVLNLWTGSWIAALCVGVLVWALIIWCVIVYRKRKDDNRLPVQLRYHLPLELLYTFVPIVMVGVLFYYTAILQEEITNPDAEPDVHVTVYGRQWSWDFVYEDEDVWDAGMPAELDGTMAPAGDLPTLYLPVDQTVEIQLRSRDVAHSFWVPAFLYKEDLLPGVENEFVITPGEEGTYLGKCAELCGEYHGNMLFNVEVVSAEEYEQRMTELREAGQTGEMGPELDRDNAADIPDPTVVDEGAEN